MTTISNHLSNLGAFHYNKLPTADHTHLVKANGCKQFYDRKLFSSFFENFKTHWLLVQCRVAAMPQDILVPLTNEY